MVGIHFLAELSGCQNKKCLCDRETLKEEVLKLIRKSGLRRLHSFFYQFQDKDKRLGVTGVVVLAESHISVHTWPELRQGYVNLDVFVCNYLKDNSQVAKALCHNLISLFSPKQKRLKVIIR